jgi:hypothetical protein
VPKAKLYIFSCAIKVWKGNLEIFMLDRGVSVDIGGLNKNFLLIIVLSIYNFGMSYSWVVRTFV